MDDKHIFFQLKMRLAISKKKIKKKILIYIIPDHFKDSGLEFQYWMCLKNYKNIKHIHIKNKITEEVL